MEILAIFDSQHGEAKIWYVNELFNADYSQFN